jgi:DNA-binding response OmpR family regulator
LRAVLRRSVLTQAAVQDHSQPVVVGPLRMEEESRSAWLHEEPLTLTAVEFDILLSLAKAAGRVKSREQLLLDS